MHGKRILILGCCGSGKTTFALKLGELTGLPVVHLDKLFWKPGWVQPTREEFYPKLETELLKDAWIMDGNYGSSLPLRLRYCDAVIYFDLPRPVCMTGILSRSVKNRGQTRPDMGEGCPERINGEFVLYTWRFKKNRRTPAKGSAARLRQARCPVTVTSGG